MSLTSLDSKLSVLISKEEIAQKIQEVALQMQQEGLTQDLVMVMVMKGALCLVADLLRALPFSVEIESVQCSSYGARGMERGELTVNGLQSLDIQGRDVLLVDDIFDSGHTLNTVANALRQKHPRSLRSLVLLVKNVPRTIPWRPDYVLFEIENHFVVGYGLDYKEKYRGLEAIYRLTDPSF